MRKLSLLAFLLAAPVIAATPPREPGEASLLERFDDWLEEVREIEGRFRGNVSLSSGSTLLDMAKIDFILGQSPVPRRYLHHQDHNLVFSAVKGQSAAELEKNLPAICNYVQLAMAASMYHSKARSIKPMLGERRGLAEVREIAKRVYEFRQAHLERIHSGAILPSRVLTQANLNELGDMRTLQLLQAAYQSGQEQFANQRNSVIIVALIMQVALAFVLAKAVIGRRKPLTAFRAE